MAKKILLMALAILLSGAGAAPAAEMGGSYYFLKKGMFEISVQGSYVNEQKMKDTTLTANSTTGNIIAPKTGVKLKQDTHMGVIVAYGLHDRVTIWAELGAATDGRLSGDITVPGVSGTFQVEGALENVFTWGLGIKARLYQYKKKKGFGVAASLRYFRYDDRPLDSWSVTGGGADTTGLTTDTQYSFWQADATISAYWKFKHLVPYIGARYSYAEGSLTGSWNLPGTANGSVDSDYEPEMELGFFAGVDFHFYKHWRLNLQGNFYNTTALLVSGSYIF